MNSNAFHKTSKGLAEIANNSYQLDHKSRQILILINESISVQQLQQMRPNLDVVSIIQLLIEAGFVTSTQPVSPARVTISVVEPVAVVDIETLAAVKQIMTDSTKEFIGILGADLIRKIEAVKDDAQLKTCIAQWHMALRDSRYGKPVADQLLDNLKSMLG